ncbi:MAG: hypothetical protein KTR19_13295 [Hyphomicrobiales bacterium]|nr:hypothetical protein [Hyphomicrobiales bacterium]
MSLASKRARRIAATQQVLFQVEEQRLMQMKERLKQLETAIQDGARALNETNDSMMAGLFAKRLTNLSAEQETTKTAYREQLQVVMRRQGKRKIAQQKAKDAAAAEELHRDKLEAEEIIEHAIFPNLTSLP